MSTICYDIFHDAVHVQELCGLLDRLEGIRPLEVKTETPRIQEFKQLVTSNQHLAIIQKLFAETDFVLSKATDNEALNFFSVLTSLTFKIAKGSASVISDLLNRLQANTAEKTNIRLHVLVDIYNLDQDANRKFSTLLAILNYARLTNQGDAVLAQFKSVEEWERELHLTAEKHRELCLALLQLLQNKKESLPILSIYLKSFNNESALVIESAFDNIQKLVLNTIKSVDIHHIDISNLTAITTFKDKPFYKLVEIFSVGNCKAFKEIFSVNNYLSSEDFDLLLEKIRILTITSVFSSKQVVPFSEVASALDIAVDDVEAWVVDASSRDLISVRIDQPQRQIIVKYSAKRSFEQKDWEILGQRVTTCRENINSLLETVRRAKQATSHQNSDK